MVNGFWGESWRRLMLMSPWMVMDVFGCSVRIVLIAASRSL